MSFDARTFISYSSHTRTLQREQFLSGQRKDTQPSQRFNDRSYLNAADREKWHLKVIEDADRARAGLPVLHR